MKKTIYTFILLCLMMKQNAQSDNFKVQPVDDFAKHVYAGVIVNTGISTAMYLKTKKIGLSCATGFLSGLFVGGVKELAYDKMMGKGTPTLKDFLATAWGASIAFPIVRSGIDIHEKRELEKEYFQFLGDSLRSVAR